MSYTVPETLRVREDEEATGYAWDETEVDREQRSDSSSDGKVKPPSPRLAALNDRWNGVTPSSEISLKVQRGHM